MGAVRIRGLQQIQNDFRQFELGLPRAQKRFLEVIGRSALQMLRANTPVTTGQLKRSWRILEQSRTTVAIGVSQDMMGILELVRKGSPPFVQQASGGQVMRFVIGGQEIFTTRVFHPGFRKNDFVSDVARAIQALTIETLDQAVSREIPMIRKARRSGQVFSTGGFRQTSNLTRTVGLSKFGAGRAFGRASLVRSRTGKKSNRRRVGLRRRRGGSINSQKVLARLKGLG